MKQNIIMVIAIAGWGLFLGVNYVRSTEVAKCKLEVEALKAPSAVK